jgi:hypothetical protein
MPLTIGSQSHDANMWLSCLQLLFDALACEGLQNTGYPTTYQTLQYFNNSNTNDDIAKRFEQQHFRCVRNEEECVCSTPNWSRYIEL